jgi:hypothetical protein
LIFVPAASGGGGADPNAVQKTGDTMTGPLKIQQSDGFNSITMDGLGFNLYDTSDNSNVVLTNAQLAFQGIGGSSASSNKTTLGVNDVSFGHKSYNGGNQPIHLSQSNQGEFYIALGAGAPFPFSDLQHGHAIRVSSDAGNAIGYGSDGSIFAPVASGGGLADAPNDANYYARHALAWSPVLATVGGTLTGALNGTTAAFSGAVTTATATAGDSSTKAATTAFVGAALGGYLPLTGGTMTGALTVNAGSITISPSGTNVNMRIRKSASGLAAVVVGYTGTAIRWTVQVGDASPESSGNLGSNFSIDRYNDLGQVIDSPLVINRQSGLTTVTADPTTALGIATKQYVDAHAGGGVLVNSQFQVFSLSANGATALNWTNGEVQKITLAGNATFTATGWPAAGVQAKIVLDILNPGTFAITGWPTGTKWAGGVVPTVTPNGQDVIVLMTLDGGATILGSVAGQGYA